jgi:dipeptidyl aminopeptidase/acylaminoacyl peptidase
MKEAAYGTWDSQISAEQIASNNISFGDTVGDQDCFYNIEVRPSEKGRYVIVKYDGSVAKTEVLPEPFNARTKIHEYGGRAFTVANGIIYFVNFADQNLYKIVPGGQAQALTNNKVRFAELNMTPIGLVAVAERHKEDKTEADNFIALINPVTGEMQELVSGYNFYAYPAVNQDATKIAWICWNHPNMPWDDTQLWVADLQDGKVVNRQQIDANQSGQSFLQPGWTNAGELIFISDRSNWWNLYKWNPTTKISSALCNIESDFARPLWTLGIVNWVLYGDRVLCRYSDADGVKIASILVSNVFNNAPVYPVINITVPEFSDYDKICVLNDTICFVGYSATEAPKLVSLSLPEFVNPIVLAESTKIALAADHVSVAQHIEFPTTSRQGVAYAYYYPPTNPEYSAPAGTKPPLMVVIHGGPTAAASGAFSFLKQFWTSRGFAVADVNYGGSTGYGRKFRKALQRDTEDGSGYWGDIDMKDCAACVEYLAAQGLIDPNKAVIRGGSAGGYTTLAALAFTDKFKAGTSYYGVSDILLLAKETHKFEARYMDQLVGALPQHEALYNARSPIHHLENFTAPLLVFQGADDKIVLPNQAEMMVEALQKLGVRVEYQLYEGEGHGFKNATTIVDTLNRELAFYLSVFYGNTLEVQEKKAPRLTMNKIF